MNQRSLIAANKDKRNLFVAGILALVLPLYIFNSNIVSNPCYPQLVDILYS